MESVPPGEPATPPGSLGFPEKAAPLSGSRAGSRAGRNLPVAIGVGVGLGAVIVACLLLVRPGFVGIVALAVAGGVWEMRGTCKRAAGINLVWVPLGAGVVATVVLTWWYGHQAQVIAVALTCLVILVWRFAGGSTGYLRDVATSMFLACYLGLFASFATLMVHPTDGAQRILTFMIVVACSDTGGYAAGALLGKHPMAPTISPKKSWEGFGGSVLLAMIGGALSVWLMLHHPWWQGAVLGVAIAVVATCGDLAESLMKRDLGVKDMGSLLPGHGGLMDRLDSLLPSAVVCWMLLAVFVPV